MTQPTTKTKFQRRMAQAVLLAFSFQIQTPALASSISNIPLATQATGTARSNLMFIMDNSGSMSWDYLPDDADYSNLCFGYHGTNYIFYNPSTTYTPPPNADGSLKSPAVFNNAKNDGYSSSNTGTNLSVLGNLNTPSTRVGTNNGNAVNSRFYYATYKANATPSTPDCGNGYDWTKWDIVTSLPAAQQANYANWWAYYRTRMLTMRGAVGRVMQNLDASRFRVGYNAIDDTQYSNSSGFLRIGDFDAGTQKADFYSKLYGQTFMSNAGTPLRPALEKIGKYYAGRQRDGSALPSGADPLQYSCQRNYTLITTDGYWNTPAEPNNYSPTNLRNTAAIGNADSGNAVALGRRDDGRTVSGSWVTGGSGVPGTLADIAMYFYETDLRDPSVLGTSCTGSIANQNLCDNNVAFENPPNWGIERVQHQRMTTYALGLGVPGTLTYRSDYDTATTGSYLNIKNGNLPWPNPAFTLSGGTWSPQTGYSYPSRADDLWHAAVNGRGRYYSASNPADVITGLSNALDAITAATGTSSAAATSSQLPVTGDNFAYIGQYTTVLWEGNVKALTIDPTTGTVSTTPLWEAKSTLKAQVGATTDSRTIFFRDAAVANTKLAPFFYANLNAVVGLGANFSNACQTGNYKLSQCATLVAQDTANSNTNLQTAVNNGTNLVNFLRGRTGKEDSAANAVADRLFRNRPNTPLGDVVNAAPVYVKKPPFRYTDAGYNTFVTNNATRTAVVYVAANDGMLHALNATTGAEMWAYVPTAVMGEMWRLADANYDTSHRYFVDGTPVVGDVYDGSNWRTILVGGLGGGGRAYYALDVTDPANPKSLWEISNTTEPDLGFTFGNPVITKNKAGVWVVAFSSGYNNHTAGGNGNGHLFVRDAISGAALSKISTFTTGTTPAGDTTTPSELGKINPWIDDETNNTAKRFYAGDMLGYMWRFDFDDNIAPTGNEAMLLGRALTSGGLVQPITTKPIPFKVDNNSARPAIAFATGRYLGTGDIGDTTMQSLYVIKDTLGTTGLGTVRNDPTIVAQSMSAARVVTANPVDWDVKNGWYIDFAGVPAGERVNVDVLQSADVLTVATNQPSPSACNPGGNSALYFFSANRGSLNAPAILYTTLTAGLNRIKLGSSTKIIRWDVFGQPIVEEERRPPPPPGSAARRSSWRELIN